jgi:hypothetical protein
MSDYDDDYDYERELDDDDDDEESVEKRVWQLLLLINPGDEEAASQQFELYRATADEEGDEDPVRIVATVTDWRSSFVVDADDTREFIEAITELVGRWNLEIDWGGDIHDDDFHEEVDGPELFSRAFDDLNSKGYTLWAREADEDDTYAGWITSSRDDESMRVVATALGVNLRLGNQVM